MSSITVILLLLGLATSAISEDNFDVRLHLSSVSRYGTIKDIGDNSFASSKIPDQCTPIHLNLLARHGTRAPTKKKMREFDTLSSRLEVLLNNLKDRKKSSIRVPAWLWGWRSPWIGKPTGGELIKQGEDDLYHLGIRVREKFPQLFSEEYHPDIYPIKATQIPRASASAVAFGMGLFSGRGNLGPGYHRAFAVTSESRASDTVLRFHECCQNYKAFRKSQQPAVDKLKEPILDEITQELIRRYGVNFSKQETASLWSLCKQEASLLDITNQACGLFNPSEVLLLEWTDDLELFKLKGYGNSLNYQMGVPLLEDVIQSMEQAIVDNEKSDVLGRHEKARMRFAHAETLLPFSCLLGLFLEGSDFEKIQREQTLELPPKPPQKRFWRGSLAVPFAGNNMLVLYSCPDSNSSKYNSSKYFVQVQHNEHPTPLPGCNGSDFCPFDVFKERIAAPHLKRDYNALCNAKTDEPRQRKPTSTVSKLLSWLLFWENSDSDATNRTEL